MISSGIGRGNAWQMSLFQSRNRGSFDFKLTAKLGINHSTQGFNLVIEVLLISRFLYGFSNHIRGSRFNLVIEVLLISSQYLTWKYVDQGNLMFQSRNRGSFDFKLSSTNSSICPCSAFQSRNRGSFDFKEETPRQWELTILAVSIS